MEGDEVHAFGLGVVYHTIAWGILQQLSTVAKDVPSYSGQLMSIAGWLSELSFPLLLAHRQVVRVAFDELPPLRALAKDFLERGRILWMMVFVPPLLLASIAVAMVLQFFVVRPWTLVASAMEMRYPNMSALAGLAYSLAAVVSYSLWVPGLDQRVLVGTGF